MLAVKTCEPERAEKELLWELFNARYEDGTPPYNCYSWDVVNGIRQWGIVDGEDGGSRQLGYKAVNERTPGDEEYPDEIFPLRWLSRQPDSAVLFAWNYHKFLVPQAIHAIQSMQNYRDDWKRQQKTLVLLVPDIEIVKELDKSITIIDFDLPDKAKITAVLEELASGNGIQVDNGAKDVLANAATGLTLFEAENAFALSFSHEQSAFDPRVVMEQKAQMVKKNACLEYSHFTETFAAIGGLDNLKKFCANIIGSDLARGVLLLGVPGGGKSLFAKALGNEAKLPTLSLDMGRVFGSLVGESERKMRDAFSIIDAMAPAILYLDEIERGLSGSGSSGQTDSGVTSRVLGTFLTWLNDHKSKIFIVCTANNIKGVPPEFFRAGRFDATFFVDLPTPEEQRTILNIHAEKYGVQAGPVPNITNWTGAEIETMCRHASIMGSMSEAAQYIVPIYQSRGKEIEELRAYARNNCVPASIPQSQVKATVGRKMRHGTSSQN